MKLDQILNFAEWNIILEPKWPLFSSKRAFVWKVEAPKSGTNRFQDFVKIRLPNLLAKFDMTILSICYLPFPKNWRVANSKHWVHPPPRSLTVRRWKGSMLRRKNHLPIVLFVHIMFMYLYVFLILSTVVMSFVIQWATTEMNILTKKYSSLDLDLGIDWIHAIDPQNLRSTWSTWQKLWWSMWSQAQENYAESPRMWSFVCGKTAPKKRDLFQSGECCPKGHALKSFWSFSWRFRVVVDSNNNPGSCVSRSTILFKFHYLPEKRHTLCSQLVPIMKSLVLMISWVKISVATWWFFVVSPLSRKLPPARFCR